jgi:hypothetical protein
MIQVSLHPDGFGSHRMPIGDEAERHSESDEDRRGSGEEKMRPIRNEGRGLQTPRAFPAGPRYPTPPKARK